MVAEYGARLSHLEFKLINDGVFDAEKRLGAIGDLDFVLRREGIDDDILVVAGDNSANCLHGFGEFCRRKNAPVLGVYDA